MVWKPSIMTCSRSRASGEHLSGQQVFLEREDFDFAVGGLPERRRENPGPGAGVEQPPGNDASIPERLGERTHDGRRSVECRQRRIAHALHEVFIPLFAAGIMAQQFVQFPHLREEFPVCLSLREVVVRSGRLQDAFQRSGSRCTQPGRLAAVGTVLPVMRKRYAGRRYSPPDVFFYCMPCSSMWVWMSPVSSNRRFL